MRPKWRLIIIYIIINHKNYLTKLIWQDMNHQDNELRATHLKLGELGEDLVAEFLEITQHEILERNWRSGKAEVDIIAKTTDGTMLFIEVKTRTCLDF